jgi:hypothetical protein
MNKPYIATAGSALRHRLIDDMTLVGAGHRANPLLKAVEFAHQHGMDRQQRRAHRFQSGMADDQFPDPFGNPRHQTRCHARNVVWRNLSMLRQEVQGAGAARHA